MSASLVNQLQFIKGSPVDAASLKGKKVLVLEFWATWCPPCRTSIPHLTEVAHRFKDKAIVIGVTNEQDESKIRKFVKDMGAQMDYTVAIDGNDVLMSDLSQAHNVRGIPHSFIFNSDLKVAWNGHPMDPKFEEALQREVNRLPKIEAVPQPAPTPARDVRGMNHDQISALSVKELKQALSSKGIDFSDCLEKADLVKRLESKM